MSLGQQVRRGLYSSPWLLFGYLTSFAFQILQLKYSSDQAIESSSLFIASTLILSSVAQCGIPAKVYYDYINCASVSSNSFLDQVAAHLSSLAFVTSLLFASTAFCLIIGSSLYSFSFSLLTFILCAIYFVILPFNQLYTGICYALGKAGWVSIFLLLEPLFRLLILLLILPLQRSLSYLNIVLIYTLSSLFQFCVTCCVDSEYRKIIGRSLTPIYFTNFSRHLNVIYKSWPYGMQQLISNFSEQFPTVVVTMTMLPGPSAYFVLLNRISSLVTVLPTHLVKLSLASMPRSLFAHVTKPGLYLLRHPRFPVASLAMLMIFVASWIALKYLSPTEAVIPATLTSLLISFVAAFRIWYLLIDAHFARLFIPFRSALVKSYAVATSLLIFLVIRYSFNYLRPINQSSHLVAFTFVLLSACPIIFITFRMHRHSQN